MAASERLLQHGATWVVGASGVAYAWMRYLLPEPADPFSVARHPLQPLALAVHVLSAPLFLLGVGMILRGHILAGLRRRGRRGRLSGSVAVGLLLPMIASGYLLQTTTSEAWRQGLVAVHLVAGGGFLLVYGGHLVATRWTAARGISRSLEPAE